MRHQNQAGAIGDSFFKGGGDLVEVLRRNRNLNQLELQAFAFLALAQRGQHARIILGGGENFVAGFEVHAHQQNLERLGSVARDRDLFAIAAEQFRQAGANGFRLRLENLPHRVGGGVFLLPDVTDQRFGHDPRAGRNAAVVQVDDAARDGERVLNDGPVVFVHGRLFRRQMRDGFRRGFDVFQQRRDRCGRKRGQAEAFAGERKKVASRAHRGKYEERSMKEEGRTKNYATALSQNNG